MPFERQHPRVWKPKSAESMPGIKAEMDGLCGTQQEVMGTLAFSDRGVNP